MPSRGWIQYYGRFHRSAIAKALQTINQALTTWVQRKYKTLRRHRTRAARWLAGEGAADLPGHRPRRPSRRAVADLVDADWVSALGTPGATAQAAAALDHLAFGDIVNARFLVPDGVFDALCYEAVLLMASEASWMMAIVRVTHLVQLGDGLVGARRTRHRQGRIAALAPRGGGLRPSLTQPPFVAVGWVSGRWGDPGRAHALIQTARSGSFCPSAGSPRNTLPPPVVLASLSRGAPLAVDPPLVAEWRQGHEPVVSVRRRSRRRRAAGRSHRCHAVGGRARQGRSSGVSAAAAGAGWER
jgi:hypothetical protein